ncbi:hypothetical protein D4R20_03550 [bacterium]|nr:MAG: hypothetical protein D4R20_03550 [bacterium]
MNNFIRFSIILLAVCVLSCGKKEEKQDNKSLSGGVFSWSENISIDKIPDFPVRGMINGKEVKFDYVNFEKWRGSEDNTINFSQKKPAQNCGFVDYDAFITRVHGDFLLQGDFIKENFSKNIDGYTSSLIYDADSNPKKISVPWNCVLVFKEVNDNVVKGKIAICFKDDKKSWIAGTFEAIRCNN